jgi:predicted nucleic acid-binding protein
LVEQMVAEEERTSSHFERVKDLIGAASTGQATLSAWRGPVVTTEAVVTEAAYLLSSAGADGTLPIQFCLRGGAVVKPWTDTRADRAGELMRKYRDVPMDYADATLVALAEELDTPNAFTLDLRGFRTYRWKTRRAFKIYPQT